MNDTDNDAFDGQSFWRLVPSQNTKLRADEAVAFRSTRVGKGMMATVPIILAGAMTVSMNLATPHSPDLGDQKRPTKPRIPFSAAAQARPVVATMASATSTVTSGTITDAAVTTAALAPSSYTVKAGDTVSAIAARFGLSTATVLAANGLSWKSLIFPGQVLTLTPRTVSAPAPTPVVTPASTPASTSASTRYTIKKGDTISAIASRFGLTVQSVLSANGLGWTSIIYPGQSLTIPGAGTLAIQTVASITPITAPPVTAPPTTPVATSTPAPVLGSSYTIRAGDTLSAIASRFGVTVASLQAANGLGGSSMIYAGRTLIIPASTVAAVSTISSGVAPLTAEMANNARTIIQVGQQLGVPDRGIVIALSAAMQESGLRNLSSGDRDSVGVFQQRPSTGWGTPAQLQNVSYAAQLFYGGPANPNKGRTRGLLDIPGWQSMTVTQAAQAVQISAYPNAYAQWETSATAWLAQLR